MAKKTEQQFGNDELMGSMFATKKDQEKPQTTSNKGDTDKSNTGAKLNNQSTKQVNTTAEPRSQRRQLLLTDQLNNDMKLLAIVKGISVNEMINEVMSRYVKQEMNKNPEVKNMMQKLAEMRS